MPGEFVVTIGDLSNMPRVLKGAFLKGRREPRIAMVGRSNVGKSTLVNALLEGRFAQTSNQPGKTRAIHFYLWKERGKIFADLPGYGYARASQSERRRWSEFIGAYLREDPALERLLVLLDARHGPTALDLNAIEFFKSSGIPVAFVLTKSDTLKTQSERARRRREVEDAFRKLEFSPEEILFWVSVKTGDGMTLLREFLLRSPSDRVK